MEARKYAVYEYRGYLVAGPFDTVEAAENWLQNNTVFDLYDCQEECVEWEFGCLAAAESFIRRTGIDAVPRARPRKDFDVYPYYDDTERVELRYEGEARVQEIELSNWVESADSAENVKGKMESPNRVSSRPNTGPARTPGRTVTRSPSRLVRSCASCGQDLEPRRKTFCSKQCQQVYLELFGPSLPRSESDALYDAWARNEFAD